MEGTRKGHKELKTGGQETEADRKEGMMQNERK
jgi:hypothetical protein